MHRWCLELGVFFYSPVTPSSLLLPTYTYIPIPIHLYLYLYTYTSQDKREDKPMSLLQATYGKIKERQSQQQPQPQQSSQLPQNLDHLPPNYLSQIGLDHAIFQKEPPANLRKSNFFNFILTFYDRAGQPVEIEKSKFINFVEKEQKDLTKNGTYLCLLSKPW